MTPSCPSDRFWSKIVRDPDTECWIWTGAIADTGYGSFWPGGDRRAGGTSAHRYAYEMLVGPIPVGLHIDHLCKVRRCVNPAHLEAVTQAENNRRAGNQYVRRLACKHGHRYEGDSFYVREGTRLCRICQRQRRQQRHAA